MNPQILADFLSQQTGLEVELYSTSEGAIIEALRFETCRHCIHGCRGSMDGLATVRIGSLSRRYKIR